MLKENLEEVRRRAWAACERAGRKREDVTLIAVSKTKPVSAIREIMDCGVVDFGENKVQELCGKIEEIEEPLHWHLIGHLQQMSIKPCTEFWRTIRRRRPPRQTCRRWDSHRKT